MTVRTAGIAVLVAASAALTACAGGSATSDATTQPSETTGSGPADSPGGGAPAPGAVPAPPQAQPAAEPGTDKPAAAIAAVVAATDELMADPDANGAAAQDFAGAAMLADIKAQQAELADQGLRATGESAVLWTKTRVSGATATVTACVDSSGVKVVDSDGNEQPTSNTAPVLQTYTVKRADGAWTVVSRTFPDDPFCAPKEAS